MKLYWHTHIYLEQDLEVRLSFSSTKQFLDQVDRETLNIACSLVKEMSDGIVGREHGF